MWGVTLSEINCLIIYQWKEKHINLEEPLIETNESQIKGHSRKSCKYKLQSHLKIHSANFFNSPYFFTTKKKKMLIFNYLHYN